MATHNRRYKDSVFVDFFGEDKNAKSNFLSLYNALHDTHLDETAELEPLRLEQVMYMAFRNDVACLVDGKIIVLAEHQSTINANMPLRFLQYAARLYERIQNPRDRYLRRLKKIPTPEFYVLYNGEEDYPEKVTLRLSDAFMTVPERPALEVVVSVTNINYNKGSKILHTCKPLKEYTLFVEAVRRHTKLDSENGFRNAIKECIQNDILREYLQRKSREVMNMLIAEYDYDVDIAVQREEEREIALKEGIAQGEAKGAYQKALETAKNLLGLGLSVATIAQATGLAEAEIESL
ncbi:transposase, YhgA-like domain protein [Treponema socranskii subsp. socranskii VPI DR56BR1116 = ATCC 35536]|uniref:Transposase, YhgA-like domain protein n=2 Tax=Treponema socranskii subsp. socranskii VPI DR56BR1116 = ATCC 35536 TaxID=1125725 RepID=U1FJL1_TRESO|nr:Rpn family recombination-promoting nuclease/putative transposase [Treponema socranskii]ERF59973.1 transposase, YhgA-like domain protein [Treponema socranskii subsp. socranskii VPI DR56BR1116 = ATCC 35536]